MTWYDFFEEEKKKEYYKDLMEFVNYEYKNFTCYPKYEDIFNAFKLTSLENTKVVILGQDPYHNVGQAHGLSFSVKCEKLPPSLINVYKEMESDLGEKVVQDGNLEYLAKEGVLLLNTTLSVREHEPLSHAKKGWETLTDNVIKLLNKENRPIVFILWGKNAQSKKKFLDNDKHLVIEGNHPSPLSAYRGFFGSKPFSKTNEFLEKNNIKGIRWIK